jgi:hypothetical protein
MAFWDLIISALCVTMAAMNPRIQALRERLASVQSAEAEADLKLLEETVTAIFQEGLASQCFADLFRIFERFPESDGFGLFWSILHKLEAVPGYEPALLESVERAPSLFTITMISRLINGGKPQIGSRDLMQVLKHTASRADIPDAVREEAEESVN